METTQLKRNIAYKLRINDLLIGKPVLDGERFNSLELGSKKIVRVNIIGNIVDRYQSEGERKYLFLTLDDGSGQIKLKIFGEDVPRFTDKIPGMTIVTIGTLRFFNGELYISPEIIREMDPKYLMVRKLELTKDAGKNSEEVVKEQIIAVKDRILEAIKNADEQGGVEVEKIILSLRNVSPEIINQEVQKFLEEGIIFEPRPGKVRYLG